QVDLALLDQAQHLFVMHQFLTGQARHVIDQVQSVVVAGDQAQRRRSGLEFTVLVIEQEDVLLRQRDTYPGSGRAAAEEIVNFRQTHASLPKFARRRVRKGVTTTDNSMNLGSVAETGHYTSAGP